MNGRFELTHLNFIASVSRQSSQTSHSCAGLHFTDNKL